MFAVKTKGNKQMQSLRRTIPVGRIGRRRPIRQYRSGYGKKYGGKMSAKGIVPESYPLQQPQSSSKAPVEIKGIHKHEIQVLKEQARTIEARLYYLKKRIRGIESDSTPPVVIAFVDPDMCVGCRACQDVCPAGAISVGEIARVDPKRCTGCGSCVEQCPRNALSLHPFI